MYFMHALNEAAEETLIHFKLVLLAKYQVE